MKPRLVGHQRARRTFAEFLVDTVEANAVVTLASLIFMVVVALYLVGLVVQAVVRFG